MASGVSIAPLDGVQPSTTIVAITSGTGDQSVITGVAGQIIKVYRMHLSATTSGIAVITMKSSGAANTAISGLFTITSGGNVNFHYDGTPWFTGVTGGSLIVSLTAVASVGGEILASIQPAAITGIPPAASS